MSVVAVADDASKLRVTLDGLVRGRIGPTRCTATVQADCGGPGAPLWLDFGETELTPGGATLVSLPFARGSRAMRFVVREYEQHVADAIGRADISQTRSVERLVYADVVEI